MADGGMLDRAVELMIALHFNQKPYGAAYVHVVSDAATADLAIWNKNDRKRRVGDLNALPTHFVVPWILRVAEANVLAAAFLTDVLARWSQYAGLLSESGREFPSAAAKRELTQETSPYLIEFAVPTGAAWRVHGDGQGGGITHTAGFQGVALVERCHLSTVAGRQSGGWGVIPGFGRCETLLGFDLPCRYLPEVHMEGRCLVSPEKPRRDQFDCDVPYGFVTRAWAGDFGLSRLPSPEDECDPHPMLEPKAAADLALRLIAGAPSTAEG